MAAITLRPADQAALHALLAAEPVPGTPMPARNVLELISSLVPCDGIGAVLADNHGHLLEDVKLHATRADVRNKAHGTGPFYLGVMHWTAHPVALQRCNALAELVDGAAIDAVAVGFRNGPDHVVQLYVARKRTHFTERDVAILQILSPVIQRLVRERPTPQLPVSLTVSERRVLMEVAGGRSNAEIAQHLFIAPSTVRKHLEHIFRKLGVTSRLAAVARMQGRDLTDLDLRQRLERYE
jgi:DNA-binding CsgD family transcriptional regulator